MILSRPRTQHLTSHLHDALGGFAEHSPSALLWAIAPTLHDAVERGTEQFPRETLSSAVRAGVGKVRGHLGMTYQRQGDILFAWATQNTRRTLSHLMTDPQHGASPRSGPRFDAIPAALRLAHRLHTAFKQEGIPTNFLRIVRLATSAAVASTEARLVLDTSPRLVVVSNQHTPNARALISASRLRNIATVYVPHAPFASSHAYEDLPTDYAMLRGRGEVDEYRRIGVNPSRLHVMGNPAVSVGDLPEIRSAEPAVLALSPNGRDVIRDLCRLVESAAGPNVLVAPHPRSDHQMLRELANPRWQISRTRTYEVLRRGPWCVMQHSSGVAWESLALGLPTVQLNYSGEEPNYPLIRSPYVEFATSTPELNSALQRCQETAASASSREALRRWAEYWCEETGQAAALRGQQLLQQIPTGATDPIYDRWVQLLPG